MCEQQEHNIPKVYDPASVEKKWYKYWEDNGYFHAEVEEGKDAFSIVIPPPNITGQLHIGQHPARYSYPLASHDGSQHPVDARL